MTSQCHSFSLFIIFLIIFGNSSELIKANSPCNPQTQVIDTDKEILSLNTPTDSIKYCFTQDKLGAGGYDVVNYFKNNTARKGSPTHQYTYDDIVYNFISQEHKNAFIKDTEKYLPQYGGWCSMTLAMGRLTTPTYDNFKIINGKLYLFEKTLSINGQTLWNQNHEENDRNANKNYLDYLDDGKANASNN